MNSTKHTPTPWIEEEGFFIVNAETRQIVAEVPHYKENRADLAHILRCVNAHDDLVAALKYWIAHEESFGDRARIPERARAALAKASAMNYTPTPFKLRGRWLLRDGQRIACIIGKNDGTTRRAPHSHGGYGYQIVGQERTTLDWAYFDDAVRACRAALAKAEL